MTGPCSECGEDPGFDWAVCPECGHRADAPAPSPARGVSSPARWDETIIEAGPEAPSREGRARFNRVDDSYTPVREPGQARERLRFDDSGRDATILDRGGRTVSRGDETDDHTIMERRGPSSQRDDQSDHTIMGDVARKALQGPLAYLVQRNGIRTGKVHLLGQDTGIGRGPENDIILTDETVSRRHARVQREGATFKIWDLASSNFSFVIRADGERERILEPYTLNDGDTLDLGNARLTFIDVDPDDAT